MNDINNVQNEDVYYDIMLNHNFSKKLKSIEIINFNNLINIITIYDIDYY